MGLMRTALLLSLAGVLWGQVKPARLEFEVASIKPVPPQDPGSRVNVGVKVDGSQVHISWFSLKDYVRAAYQVKVYQVVGADWMGSERYNIDAKLPEGATREQVPEMLQSLLAER